MEKRQVKMADGHYLIFYTFTGKVAELRERVSPVTWDGEKG